MTVAKLAKLLAKEIARGNGRCAVCIDKPTFQHPLEPDGAVIQDVVSIRTESVVQLDDDGAFTERYRRCVVLTGHRL